MSEVVKQAIAKYILLRDEKKVIQDRHKEELKPINDKMQLIENALLKRLHQDGAKNIATEVGTVYVSNITKARVEDWQEFKQFALDNDLLDMMEHRVSKAAVEEFIEANNGEIPPGLAISTETFARIKR